MRIAILKKPSAWLPIVMSLAALAIVIIHVARFGAAREADEGTSAHLWQMLMAGQLPIIGVFSIRWLPRNVTQTLFVIGLQVIAALAALAPVYFLGL